ncbi:MAG: sigma-70 family RNA polymerase sigma factor [Bacteroidota bacterium]
MYGLEMQSSAQPLGPRQDASSIGPGPTFFEDVDDTDLARALIAGSDWAASVAWVRFSPMVRRILLRTFGPRQDIDDIQQDVFFSFFRKVAGLRQPESLRAFVVSIAVRTLKHELRSRRARRFFHLIEDAGEADARSIEQPDLGARQAFTAFYRILDRLPAADQTAFSLRFFEGFELPEVARALGVSISTAKRRLARVWKLVAARVRRDPVMFTYLTDRHLMGAAPSNVLSLGAG